MVPGSSPDNHQAPNRVPFPIAVWGRHCPVRLVLPGVETQTSCSLEGVSEPLRNTSPLQKQKPTWIHMAPLCGPWSQMQNINDQSTVEAKRRKYMPMVEFCAKVAIHQLENGRYFTIENPATSKMWYTKCFERLLRHYMVGYGTLDMCAYEG